MSYITRTGACREVLGSDMPIPAAGERGGEARKWLDAQEEADRKNARVIDKVTIALPLELNEAQRVELVREFAAEVTHGRVPWLAAVHDQGKDAANPHAHLVLRDRDLETGKMALRMSQKGSTEMLRETWERACNAALERAGVEARIDRRTLEAQGIDREPTKHIGPTAQAIEADGRESWKLEALREEAAEARREAQRAAEEAKAARKAEEEARVAKIEADNQLPYLDRKWFDLRDYGGARLDIVPNSSGSDGWGWQVEISLPRKRDFLPGSELRRSGLLHHFASVSPLGADFIKYRSERPQHFDGAKDVLNFLEQTGFDLNKIGRTRLRDFDSTPVAALLDAQTWVAVIDPIVRDPSDDPARRNLWRAVARITNALHDSQARPHSLDAIKAAREAERLPLRDQPAPLEDKDKWLSDLRKDAAAAIEWCAQDTPESFAKDGWGERIKKWAADHFAAAADLLRYRSAARDRKEAASAPPQPQPKPAPEPDRSQPKSAPPSWSGPSR